MALPPQVSCETGAPPPAAAALLEALYSEGLGELAYTNGLAGLPRPRFPRAPAPAPGGVGELGGRSGGACSCRSAAARTRSSRWRSSARSGCELALFSIGDAPPIARTVAVAGLPHLLARRTLDPGLPALNRAGALNGHVPITAIVSCVALLTAALHGFDAVAMANERSASSGNLGWDGVEVNHQFSKGLRAERLLSAAARGGLGRPAAVLGPAPGVGAGDRARVRADGALPRRVHQLQRDLPHRPGAARRVVVLRLPQVPVRVPGARALQRARASARRLRRVTCSTTSASSRASRCSPPPAGTSRSSASARSRRASPRSGCSRTTRVGAGIACSGASWPRCCRAIPPYGRRSRPGARAQRRARGASGPAGGCPCASRSLTARAIGVWGAGREIGSFAEQLARRLPRRGSSWRPSTPLPPTVCARRCGRPTRGS